MRASRGMGAIAPSKMPTGKTKARRDDTDFTEYAKGGKVKDKWIQGAIKHPGALHEQLGVALIPTSPSMALSSVPGP